MASVIIDIILLIVFLAIGFYALTRSSTKSSKGLIYLVVAIIFLLLGIYFGLGLAGISMF